MSGNSYKINPAIGEEDLEHVKTIQEGVLFQVKQNKRKGTPIARFDSKTKKPYFEYPDGRKEYGNGLFMC